MIFVKQVEMIYGIRNFLFYFLKMLLCLVYQVSIGGLFYALRAATLSAYLQNLHGACNKQAGQSQNCHA